MKPSLQLSHQFVDFIPEDLEERTLYVCVSFATVVHKCCCGCGSEVVTPLSPTDWKVTFNGETISLHPSIGNWSFKCRSHYWVQNNRVEIAAQWSHERVDAGRREDYLIKRNLSEPERDGLETVTTTNEPKTPEPKKPWWKRLWPW